MVGNQYVIGNLNGIVNFGVAILNAGNREYSFIAKRSPAGAWLWAIPIKAGSVAGNAYIADITSDATGHLFVTGRFYSPGLAVGCFSLTNTVATTNSSDIFVAMLDTNGNWLWATQAGGSEDDYPCGIVARNGAVTIAGLCSRPGATFGTTALPVNFTEAHDVFIAQLNLSGQFNWAVRGGLAPGSLSISSIALDSQDNVYSAGSYGDNLRLGSLTVPNSNRVYPDIFIAQISPTGTWLRANHVGGSYSEISGGIALDGQDNGYIAGFFESGTASFGSSTITNWSCLSSQAKVIW